MAAKGTASKSASGASMSKYDVEVEERLQVIEETLVDLKEHSHETSGGTDPRVDKIIAHLAQREDVSDLS